MGRHQLLNSTFHHGISTLHHRLGRQRRQGCCTAISRASGRPSVRAPPPNP
jgi:hypothetical protein